MLLKIHNSYRQVVAICDKELLGKKFEQGEKVLEIKESFFNGEQKTKKEIIEVIKRQSDEDATFNIVGEKSIACALKAGVVKPEGIKKIQGIPIALVLL